jgi:hypothetical protein
MKTFCTKIPNEWIVYEFDYMLLTQNIPVVDRTSPPGQWLNNRHITHELTELGENHQLLNLDVDRDTAIEFILTWSEILCAE